MFEALGTTRVRGALRSRTATFAVLLVIFCVSPNVIPYGDSFLIVPTANSLVHERDLDLSEYLDVPSVRSHYGLTNERGKVVDYFPWVTAVVATPVTLGADLVSAIIDTPIPTI